MRATELMIGDWVLQVDYLQQNRVCQITGIYDNVVVEISGKKVPLHESHIKPIPLTAEILEKNGFRKMDMQSPCIVGQHEWVYWQNMSSNVCLWTRELYDDTKEGWMLRIESTCHSLTIAVWNVHELQHALRFCGIKKEIEL